MSVAQGGSGGGWEKMRRYDGYLARSPGDKILIKGAAKEHKSIGARGNRAHNCHHTALILGL